MINPRTPRECVETVVAQVEKWIAKGLCQHCAFRVVADLTDMTVDTVETVWVDYQVELLEAETALD